MNKICLWLFVCLYIQYVFKGFSKVFVSATRKGSAA